MTYGQYRETIIHRAPREEKKVLQRNRPKTDRALFILTQLISERGVHWAHENNEQVLSFARQRTGLLASIWPTIAVAILKILIPILLQWLIDQQVLAKKTGGKPSDVDEMMTRLAFEGERDGRT